MGITDKRQYHRMNSISQKIIDCIQRGNKVLLAGNGGSSAQASHLSEELIAHAIPAIALNDPQVITALANDFSYEEVFSRYLKALGNAGDLFISFTTSGKSKNLINATKTAKELGMEVLEWPHKKGKTTEEKQNFQLVEMHRVYKEVVKALK